MGFNNPKIATKLLFERLRYRYSKFPKKVEISLFSNDKMIVVLPERVSEFLYYFKFFEYGLTRILLEYLKPGMIFCDVGAHFGYFSILASNIVGKSGQVHSFEPTKSSFDILRTNLKQENNFVNNIACWSKNSELEFNDFGIVHSAFNSFTKPKLKNNDIKENKNKIKSVRLDSYFENQVPDFVKIDAESAELEILKGMEKIFVKKLPLITIEVGDSFSEIPESKKTIEFLLEKNYNCFEFKNGRFSKHKIKETYGYDNLLFTPQMK
ncbi:FkbM family methyltransferase [Nitrosopumilus piranensis]|nr:FkbM family methyltransferase [Nitrosopumilus piranensis]